MTHYKNTRILSRLLLIGCSLAAISCSSVSERRIASQDDDSKPSWASLDKSLVAKDGMLMILGFKELDADAKISAAFRMADNSSRTELSKLIHNQFSTIFQNLEEGVGDEGEMARFYSSEVSKTSLRELRVTSRYWEKVQSFDRDGEKTYRLRVYSLAEIPESKLKKLIHETMNKDSIPAEVKKQVLDHFENEIKSFQTSN